MVQLFNPEVVRTLQNSICGSSHYANDKIKGCWDGIIVTCPAFLLKRRTTVLRHTMQCEKWAALNLHSSIIY